MSHTKLFSLLENDLKLQSLVKNLASGYIEVPYIIEQTLKILEDDSPFQNIISDVNKKSLCIMLDLYFIDCYGMYIDDMNLSKLLKFGKIEVYKIEAANGIRYATVGEVAQGVKGLIGEYIYPAGEDIYKKLCLLEWSFTGVSYFFRQAGYNLDYDNNGKPINTFYEMVQMCAKDLKDMFEWVSIKTDVDKALNRIKKLQRSNGYKYASYEKDEIKEDITIKQLITNITKVFPRNSPNIEYRKALALAIKASNNKGRLSPLEIATLRDIYDKHALDLNRSRQLISETNEELKKNCNLSKCSPKQYNIIEDALKIIGIKENTDNNTTEIISDADIDLSLASLSNAIGEGLFDEDGDE